MRTSFLRPLTLLVVTAALASACSGDRPFGPSNDPFDACTGRTVVLSLRLVVDHVSTHTILQVGDTLRVSRLEMDAGRMNGASCEGSGATMNIRWPGMSADSTFDAFWRNEGTYLEIVASRNDEHLIVAFGVRHPEASWLLRSENWTSAQGRVLAAD